MKKNKLLRLVIVLVLLLVSVTAETKNLYEIVEIKELEETDKYHGHPITVFAHIKGAKFVKGLNKNEKRELVMIVADNDGREIFVVSDFRVYGEIVGHRHIIQGTYDAFCWVGAIVHLGECIHLEKIVKDWESLNGN